MGGYKENIIAVVLTVLLGVYIYAHENELVTLMYITKPLIIPLIAVFYILKSKITSTLFVVSLFLISCSTVLFLYDKEAYFLLAMSFTIIFMLINMLLVTRALGAFEVSNFFVITVPIFFAIIWLLSIIFSKKGGPSSFVFYVFGSILAMYVSFSIYYLKVKRNKASLLNLAGVIFLFFSVITRALLEATAYKTIYSILNIVFYFSSLFLISYAVASKFEIKKLQMAT